MDQNRFHTSNEDLLLAADGELSEQRLIEVRAHIGACWACRVRMGELENTIGEVVRLTRETSGPELPPIDQARARLRARLANMAESSRPGPFWRRNDGSNYKRLACGFAMVLMLALAAGVVQRKIGERGGYAQSSAYAAALPNSALTPGATEPASLASICALKHDQVIRKVSNQMRQRVFEEYGIAGASPGDYEIDHLVTPGLGGSDDIRNLWPEPRYRTEWNSYVKDQLEDHLHQLVCGGQVKLSVAQHDIASNWISAYRKYFQTDAPLLPYAASSAPGPIYRPQDKTFGWPQFAIVAFRSRTADPTQRQ